MKRSQLISVLTLSAIFILTLQVSDASITAAAQHRFRIDEYRLFDDVLHPIQHEALPQEDFRRIRSEASELVKRGKAIVKLGVPEAPPKNRRRFARELRKFDRALAKFKSAARIGSNLKLKASFAAVHDSFERLADLVPTVYPLGSPPTISLNCPSSKAEAGSKITLTANTPIAEELAFSWAVSGGKILMGQGTRTITIDTTELAGQTISVRVEVNAGFGLMAVANCELQVSASLEQLEPVSGVHVSFIARGAFF